MPREIQPELRRGRGSLHPADASNTMSNRSKASPSSTAVSSAGKPTVKKASTKARQTRTKATRALRQPRPTKRRVGKMKSPDVTRRNDGENQTKPFPIVGIGASAGGLEAVTQLLQGLPTDTGMAFVLVQHLDPTHKSALSSVLSRVTGMPVSEARNNLRLKPNHLYIIPSNKHMEIADQRLRLIPRQQGKEAHLPIDLFLSSLAREEGGNAMGIVLSGNGADGTRGLQAVKAAGGVTFAQDQRTAAFPAMPASAIASGCVDYALPPERMASELTRQMGQLQGRPSAPERSSVRASPRDQGFEEILSLLRQRTDVDFTLYKHATLRRRFLRRMSLHKLDAFKEYAALLRRDSTEVNDLFNDVLIHVTSFFRDPAVFQALKKKLLPELIKGKSPEDPVRLWIPGCSTGEEVYSIAIVLKEVVSELKARNPVQIFGTDIHDLALERARAGLYPVTIEADISPARLRRFFFKSEGGFRINESIRELCIFARQDLAKDPPFSNLDLIACRNVLIYFDPALQHKVMPVFHYALRPEGLFVLGASESIGSFADLFALKDKKSKVYVKKAGHMRPKITFGHRLPAPAHSTTGRMTPAAKSSPTLGALQKQADRIVLDRYGLPGVVISRDLEVVQFRGGTGPYLEHAQGQASLNLLKMAREGLLVDLRAAIARAIKQDTRIRKERVRFPHQGQTVECAVEVLPFSAPPATERFYLVQFEPCLAPSATLRPSPKSRAGKDGDGTELVRLREELTMTRESLQTIIQEQEETNEELRSANEEILSSNEELQSTNEELETTKEELQATNEELTTLNDELESRNTELGRINNDLQNLLSSVDIPLLILDVDLRIRRFTHLAARMFHLLPGDVGRPVTQINLPLDIPALDVLVREVFDSLMPKDLELRDQQHHWWSVRIRPYKTTDFKIDGAVVALVNIDSLKLNAQYQEQLRRQAEAIVNTVREPLLVLNEDLKVAAVNQAFYSAFQVSPEETLNQSIYRLGNGQWDIPKLRTLLEDILPGNNSFKDFVVEHAFPHLGRRRMTLNARRLQMEAGDNAMILLAIEQEVLDA